MPFVCTTGACDTGVTKGVISELASVYYDSLDCGAGGCFAFVLVLHLPMT